MPKSGRLCGPVAGLSKMPPLSRKNILTLLAAAGSLAILAGLCMLATPGTPGSGSMVPLLNDVGNYAAEKNAVSFIFTWLLALASAHTMPCVHPEQCVPFDMLSSFLRAGWPGKRHRPRVIRGYKIFGRVL